jgi:hypothetical protein
MNVQNRQRFIAFAQVVVLAVRDDGSSFASDRTGENEREPPRHSRRQHALTNPANGSPWSLVGGLLDVGFSARSGLLSCSGVLEEWSPSA